jgi:hypothetical protein
MAAVSVPVSAAFAHAALESFVAAKLIVGATDVTAMFVSHARGN